MIIFFKLVRLLTLVAFGSTVYIICALTKCREPFVNTRALFMTRVLVTFRCSRTTVGDTIF
jgi:hypothetical protein